MGPKRKPNVPSRKESEIDYVQVLSPVSDTAGGKAYYKGEGQ